MGRSFLPTIRNSNKTTDSLAPNGSPTWNHVLSNNSQTSRLPNRKPSRRETQTSKNSKLRKKPETQLRTLLILLRSLPGISFRFARKNAKLLSITSFDVRGKTDQVKKNYLVDDAKAYDIDICIQATKISKQQDIIVRNHYRLICITPDNKVMVSSWHPKGNRTSIVSA